MVLLLTEPLALNGGVGQAKQTEIWILARKKNRPKSGYWSEQTERNVAIGETKQTEMWVLALPIRPKCVIWRDRTDQKSATRPLSWVAVDPLSATQVGLTNACSEWQTLVCVEQPYGNREDNLYLI